MGPRIVVLAALQHIEPGEEVCVEPAQARGVCFPDNCASCRTEGCALEKPPFNEDLDAGPSLSLLNELAHATMRAEMRTFEQVLNLTAALAGALYQLEELGRIRGSLNELERCALRSLRAAFADLEGALSRDPQDALPRFLGIQAGVSGIVHAAPSFSLVALPVQVALAHLVENLEEQA